MPTENTKVPTDQELVSKLREKYPENPEKVFKLILKEYNMDSEELADVIEKIDYEKYIDSKDLLLGKIRAAFEAYKKNKVTNSTKWGIYTQMPDADRLFEILLDYYYDAEYLLSDFDNDTLFNVVKNFHEFDEYVEKERDDAYHEGYNDAEEFYQNRHTTKELLDVTNVNEQESILDMYPEDLWKFLCNVLHVGAYYDSDKLMMKIDDVINKLKKSIYYKNK